MQPETIELLRKMEHYYNAKEHSAQMRHWQDIVEQLDSLRTRVPILVAIIEACLDQFQWGGTFVELVLPFIPAHEWPHLIEQALCVYGVAPRVYGMVGRDSAETVLTAALHQFPEFVTHIPVDLKPFWLSDDPAMRDTVGHHPERMLFLAFGPDILGESSPMRHPTYVPLAPDATLMRFGGLNSAACGICGHTLHHILTLDPIPTGIGITGMERVSFATCLSCLGWSVPTCYYQHHIDGAPSDCFAPHSLIAPEFLSGPWEESRVALVEIIDSRWRQLSWHHENMSRLGGPPFWVQGPEYRTCPSCSQRMLMVLELGNGFPYRREDGNTGRWEWGAGGLGYIAWCDACKISAVFWSST